MRTTPISRGRPIYDAKNAVALRDLAWQNLLPGARAVMEVPASLSMDFVPRRLDRRGDGLIILPAVLQGVLQDALQPHPDLLVSSSLPVERSVWTGLLMNAQNDPVAQGAARAAFYAAWRKQLVESGRSRLLQCAKLAPGEVECLYRIFPDAKFVVNEESDIPVSDADCSRFIVVGQIADDSLPDSLYKALELPLLACPDPAQLIAQGEQYFAKGDLAGAEASFREALRLDACAPDAYNNLAVVCWQRGDLAAALDLLSQGLVLDSRHLDLLENSARILLETGHRDDAEILCNQYLAINPGNKEMTALLALTRHAVG
ncbi:tetratricopeptide repeat protein [Thiogranum longum]|nr:tetratricopeptide repeat protein [Thiogranum longum]